MNPSNTELWKFYTDNLHVGDQKFRPNDEEVTFELKNSLIIPNEAKILKAKNKIVNVVKSYMGKTAAKFGARYPLDKIPFLRSDMDILFTACGISKDVVYKAADSVTANGIDSKNHLIQEPFNLMCVMIAHVYLKNDPKLVQAINDIAKGKYIPEQTKYASVVYLIILYLGMHFYSALFIKYWKYGANEAVMDYTVENMSNKFIIRKCQNLLEFIQYHTETNIENMVDRLLRASDVDLIYFYSNLNNRMSHAMRTIANNYYDNKEKQNYISNEDTSRINDEGKFFVGDTTSVSADIESTTRRILSRFFSEDVVNERIANAACVKTKFSKVKFMIILQRIKENTKNDALIKSIFTNIITYYLAVLKGSTKNIKSNSFIVDMYKVYSISNTNDKLVLAIKQELSDLVKNNSKEILDEGNSNIIERAKSSIYNYLILYIAANSK